MGKIFDDLTYATPKHLYMGAPVEEIKALNAQKSKDYTEARGTKDALDIALGNLDVRDVDYGSKKQYLDGLKGRLQSTIDKGDWQNAKYSVTDEVKKFQTDAVLNAAQKERRNELAYNADIKSRFDKGDLSQEHANWARKQGQNTAVTLNPDGTTSGGFSGGKVLDDKKITKEIYDQADKRIKDWKENSTLKAGGKEYMKAGNGQYFVKGSNEHVDAAEVRNALTNEIKSSYGDFLQQEKAVDLDHVKGGMKRSIETGDFSKTFGLNSTQDILQAKGLSDQDIKNLENSKNPKANMLVAQAKSEKKILEEKLSNPAGRDEVFNDLYDKKQMNKYTQGATNKASYDKESADWMLDHDRQENLKAKHARALHDYTKEVVVPPSNIGGINSYKIADNVDYNKTIADYTTQIKDLKGKLTTNLPNIERNKVLNDLSNIQNKALIAYNDKAGAVRAISEKSPEVAEKYMTYGLTDSNGNVGLLTEIIKNPQKYTGQLGGYAVQLQAKVDFNKVMSKKSGATAKDLKPITSEEIKTLKELVDKQKDKDVLYKAAVSSAMNVSNNNYESNILGQGSSYTSPDKIKSSLMDAETSALEKNNVNLAYTTKTYGTTDVVKEDFKALTGLFADNASSATRNGENWTRYIQDQDIVDNDGKKVIMNGKNLSVTPEINWARGEKSVRISVVGGFIKGSEDKNASSAASWSFVPGDQDGVNVTLRSAGEKLMKSGKPDGVKAGREMLAFSTYGSELGGFNPENMGNKMVANINVRGRQATIMAVKSSTGNSFKVYQVQKDPRTGEVLEGTKQELHLNAPNEAKSRSDFRSEQDLAEALYFTNDEKH